MAVSKFRAWRARIMTDLRDTLEEFKGILVAIVAILGAIAALLRMLRPLIVCVLFLATVIVPSGSIVWFFMYVAAENSNRINESIIFLSLVAQLSAAVSLYTFLWGMWLYPSLKPWFRNQVRSIPKSSEEGQVQEGEDT
jgi:hypothetical protein